MIKLTKTLYIIYLPILLLAVGLGCGPPANRIRTIFRAGKTNVVTNIPIAREFCSVFTNCQVSIASIVQKRPHRRVVQLKSDLFERYIVYLNLVVEFVGPTRLEVVSHTVETLYMSEVTSISVAENGNTAYNLGESFRFGEREWKILMTNGFRFEAIGINLKTNAPVNGFRQAIDASHGSNW